MGLEHGGDFLRMPSLVHLGGQERVMPAGDHTFSRGICGGQFALEPRELGPRDPAVPGSRSGRFLVLQPLQHLPGIGGPGRISGITVNRQIVRIQHHEADALASEGVVVVRHPQGGNDAGLLRVPHRVVVIPQQVMHRVAESGQEG